MEIKTTKEIGQDYLLFPDDNPQFKHNKKWVSVKDVVELLRNLKAYFHDKQMEEETFDILIKDLRARK